MLDKKSSDFNVGPSRLRPVERCALVVPGLVSTSVRGLRGQWGCVDRAKSPRNVHPSQWIAPYSVPVMAAALSYRQIFVHE